MKKRKLSEVDPDERGIPYAVWKAKQLNRIFEKHGLQGKPGKILPSTVQDGLEKYAARLAASRAASSEE